MTIKPLLQQEGLPASKIMSENHFTASPTVQVAISVQNISKMYPLYAKPSDRLKQSLWYALPKFLRGKPRHFYREFWALRNISFEVKKGETIGIIGRNGSGKSTLLQIIAGTLAPAAGEMQVNGRVAALLELGSGFNSEFTGRENVYLNGSILGLTQAQIDEIYDEIVAFADIGQFIDQPVKLYSSGMFVRLAFAVQVFVPKEIFIVDEALAVGDEAFQRKCFAALDTFRDNGGTVLLVSHNTQTVVRQCERCLLLSQGELLVDGPSKPVTDLYYKLMFSDAQKSSEILSTLRQEGLQSALFYSQAELQPRNGTEPETAPPTTAVEQWTPSGEPGDWFDPNVPKTNEVVYGNGDAEIFDYGMYNEQGQKVNVLVTGRIYQWRYRVKFYKTAYKVNFGFLIKTVDGIDVAGTNNHFEQCSVESIPGGAIVEAVFGLKLNVAPGVYFLNSGVSSETTEEFYLHRRVDLCSLRVISANRRETVGIVYIEPTFAYRLLDKGEVIDE